MIRNAVIHLQGKLPVVVDLRQAPSSSDTALVCTNLRTRDGKKPSFIEETNAWFLIPMHEVTILELPAGSLDETADAPAPGGRRSREARNGHAAERPAGGADGPGVVMLGPGPDPLDGQAIEPDEDLLARIRSL